MLRGIALELERLANHTGDLGALAGDVGYLPTAAFCGRLRGDFVGWKVASRYGNGNFFGSFRSRHVRILTSRVARFY